MLVPVQFFNDQPPPAALPGSPLFDRLVLERPLVLLVALCAAAGFTLMVAIARDQRRIGATIAALLLLAAAGVFVLSALVQTPREALAARTRTLIAALATVDTPALDDLLADNAVMRYAFARGGIGKIRHTTINKIFPTQALLRKDRVGKRLTVSAPRWT